jgi:hypothetical protein
MFGNARLTCHCLECLVSQEENVSGPNLSNLRCKVVVRTGLCLDSFGFAVLWWSALDCVSHVQAVSAQSCALEALVQQLPSSAREHDASLFLITTWRLAHDHYPRSGIAAAHHTHPVGVLVERAQLAVVVS